MGTLGYRMSIFALVALFGFGGATAQDAKGPWSDAIDAPFYFAVLVADVDKSVDWYRSIFGLRQIDDSQAEDGSWRIVNLRNSRLFVEIIRDNRAQAVDRARGFLKVGFQVPDVRVVAEGFGKTDEERPRIIDDNRHGIRLVQIRDPDGNIVQVFSVIE